MSCLYDRCSALAVCLMILTHCVCVCVCVCVCARARACVCVCARVCVFLSVYFFFFERPLACMTECSLLACSEVRLSTAVPRCIQGSVCVGERCHSCVCVCDQGWPGALISAR